MGKKQGFCISCLIGLILANANAATQKKVYFKENFSKKENSGWNAVFDKNFKTQSNVSVVREKDNVPMNKNNYALLLEGGNVWNSTWFDLPQPISLKENVYVKVDFYTGGAADTLGLMVIAKKFGPTYCVLSPTRRKSNGNWTTAIWRINDYFPDFDYKNPEDIVITGIKFNQRVSGGHEKPGGKADNHWALIDNIEIASNGTKEGPFSAEIDKIAGIRYYTGKQNYIIGKIKNSEGNMTVWHAPSTVKIFRKQPLPENSGSGIKVAGAKNEYESFQLVFSADKTDKNISIKAADLKNSHGGIIKSENIRWNPLCYLPIFARYFGIACHQEWPGPMSWNRSFEVKAGENQPVWITVYIPPNTAPGEYKGLIDIYQDEKKISSVPLSVKVWNFNFPVKVRYRTNQQIWGATNPEWDSRPPEEITADGARLLGMCHMVDANRFPRYPRALQEELMEKYGVNTIKLPFCGGHQGGAHIKITKMKGFEPFTEGYEKAFCKWLRKQVDRYKSKGLLDCCFLYLWDETWADFKANEIIKYIGGLSKKVEPRLETLVANPFYPDMEPYVDIFLAGYTEPEKRKEAVERGKKFWWWANSAMSLDKPGIDARTAFGLRSIAEGMSGAYAWGIYVLADTKRKIKNPDFGGKWRFTDPWKLPTCTNYSANVIWPGRHPESKAQRLVSSINLEMLRDGIEDYEYYMMIKEADLSKQKGLEGKRKELLSRAEKFCGKTEKSLRDDFSQVDEIPSLRQEMAEFLEKIKTPQN